MDSWERIGIIDIGSNSIRLAIYEINSAGAYRIIDESKEGARLSERVDGNGRISDNDLDYIAETLQRFKLLCAVQGAGRIRAVATAALRNAAHSAAVTAALRERTGLAIDVLPGEEEGRLGFLGMINTIDISDGLLVDIGGGSTEVTLFRNRRLVKSVSFPFGAVNTMKRFGSNGEIEDEGAKAIRAMVDGAVASEPWIAETPGLPLVGLGGTVRSLCKIDQKRKKYSLPLTHNYTMSAEDMDATMQLLRETPYEKRKKIEGLSKDRADIIVPGAVILHTLFRRTSASHYVISGAGLRDGLFFEQLRPEEPQFTDVLEHSVHNLLALHPVVSFKHVSQVNRLALKLFADLQHYHGLGGRAAKYLHVASLLYRVGISIHYYNYYKHTFYLLAHSRVDGLSHREIIICAMIASFKSEKRSRPFFAEHRDLLSEADFSLVVRLGSLLQLAAALDRSETQPVASVSARVFGTEMFLTVNCASNWVIERKQVMSLARDFGKMWGFTLRLFESG
ncbi:Ppx/GppA phosphatase family protein [Paenibacillus alkalitolerans]|uniref:Ppx/GppA phosphatase family protein n=1 Tax=Paenibacillus alkalitolerans TaxID=2799335 RepID=UPI0018F6B522|nr:Ppx/GppA phosphatase family protein [Paenibacillus alkalitolerans]